MKKRYYKDIEVKTFDFIYEDSPVELIDRTSCYDIESFEYYLKIRMRDLSGRDITSVKVRVDLYDGIGILPYKKIDYTYKVKKGKIATDIIGEADYIPIPQSYYKSLEVTVESVTFAGGEVQYLKPSVSKTKLIAELPNHIVTACEIVDDSESIKEKFPAVIIPQFGEHTWICCCTHKNRADAVECERCKRDRDALKAVYTEDNLEKTAHDEAHGTGTMTMRRVKSEFLEKMTPKEHNAEKERQIEEQKQKVEKREKYKEKMRIQALPRIALYFVLAYLLYFILNWIFGMVPQL